jgi:hypothetical protein
MSMSITWRHAHNTEPNSASQALAPRCAHHRPHVRKVPFGDIERLFNHLVRDHEQGRRYFQAERRSSLGIDGELEFRRKLNR